MTSPGVCIISTFVLAYVCGLCYGDFPVCTLIEVSAGDGSTISSLGYPNNYTNNNCTIWRITSATHVVLNITAFSLEPNFDFLYIFDDYKNIAKLTGYSIPARNVYESTQHYMSVQFTSDPDDVSTGFSATITSSPVETTTPAATTTSAPTRRPGLCTLIEVGTGNESTISSPNFPSNYTNRNCIIWRITSTTPIVLNITAFDLQRDYDFLYIYDEYINIARLTGSAVPAQSVYTSSNHYMLVQFISDLVQNASGFSATVTTRPVETTRAPTTTAAATTSTPVETTRAPTTTAAATTSTPVETTRASTTTAAATTSTPGLSVSKPRRIRRVHCRKRQFRRKHPIFCKLWRYCRRNIFQRKNGYGCRIIIYKFFKRLKG